jgi:hypothetical protein
MLSPEIYLALKLTQDQPTFKNVNLLGITKRMTLHQAADHTKLCYGRLTYAERTKVQHDFIDLIAVYKMAHGMTGRGR